MSRRLVVIVAAAAVVMLIVWARSSAYPTLWCSLIGTCNA
jgi:hypothetical protein